MRDDYIKDALKVIPDPNMLINVVSRRVKQLRRGNRPLVESLEKLSSEDTALREIIEGKISYEDALRNADSLNDLRLQIKLNSQRAKSLDLAAGTEGFAIV